MCMELLHGVTHQVPGSWIMDLGMQIKHIGGPALLPPTTRTRATFELKLCVFYYIFSSDYVHLKYL